jgi:hypothetical protein
MDEADSLNIGASILDELRASHSRLGDGAEPFEREIPGYDGKIIAKFKWVHPKELSVTSKQLERIKDPTEQRLAAAADSLVATCDEILVLGETLLHQGEKVTFQNGEGIGVLLGVPVTDARSACNALFNNPYAVIDVAFDVVTWLEDTSRNVASEHLGE